MEKNTHEYETFYDKIKDVNGMCRITIPHDLCQYANFKPNQPVKILIKKIEVKKK